VWEKVGTGESEVMSERDGHSSGEPGMKNKSSAETDW
jgi:hypothetical protein